MNAAIIVCSTLTNHVKAAQKKMNTNYPIIELDNSKHSRPEKFWIVFACSEADMGLMWLRERLPEAILQSSEHIMYRSAVLSDNCEI